VGERSSTSTEGIKDGISTKSWDRLQALSGSNVQVWIPGTVLDRKRRAATEEQRYVQNMETNSWWLERL
jgi:hypothetical protein